MRPYNDYKRWLYRGDRPHGFARLLNRASAIAFETGIWPKRATVLEVRGRRSDRTIRSRWSSPIMKVSATSSPCSARTQTGCATYGRPEVWLCYAMAAARPYDSKRSLWMLGLRSCGGTWRWHRGLVPTYRLIAMPHSKSSRG
jgi:hypothetical protein